MLASVAFTIFSQVGASIMLPTLSKQQENHESFKKNYSVCLEISVVGSLIILAPIVLAGGELVNLIYGPKYSGAGTLTAIFGTIVALRFFRFASAVAAMARADTVNHLFSNIARAASLLFALIIIYLGTKNMNAIAACGIAGEMCAIFVSVYRMVTKQGISLKIHLKPFLFLIVWLVVGLITNEWIEEESLWAIIVAVLSFWCMGLVSTYCLFPDTISFIYNKRQVRATPQEV
jgi:O-antigen/teichoic acid export membrane protein